MFADNPLTNWTITVLGGIAGWVFMSRLLENLAGRGPMRPSRFMLRGGLYGIAATFCAFESFCVLAALYSASTAPNTLGVPVVPRIAFGFAAWLIEFESFGVFPLAAFLPISFLVWTVAPSAFWKFGTGKTGAAQGYSAENDQRG